MKDLNIFLINFPWKATCDNCSDTLSLFLQNTHIVTFIKISEMEVNVFKLLNMLRKKRAQCTM